MPHNAMWSFLDETSSKMRQTAPQIVDWGVIRLQQLTTNGTNYLLGVKTVADTYQ
jgi:hypothetical protein